MNDTDGQATDEKRKRQRYAIAGITDLLNEFDQPEDCANVEECLCRIGAYVLMGLEDGQSDE